MEIYPCNTQRSSLGGLTSNFNLFPIYNHLFSWSISSQLHCYTEIPSRVCFTEGIRPVIAGNYLSCETTEQLRQPTYLHFQGETGVKPDPGSGNQ